MHGSTRLAAVFRCASCANRLKNFQHPRDGYRAHLSLVGVVPTSFGLTQDASGSARSACSDASVRFRTRESRHAARRLSEVLMAGIRTRLECADAFICDSLYIIRYRPTISSIIYVTQHTCGNVVTLLTVRDFVREFVCEISYTSQ